MLSIGMMGKGQGSYYTGLATEDYYFEGGEPPGQWIGEGAALLGLSGQVDNQQFLKLFAGYAADGSPLVQNAGAAHRRPGVDLTFSAPKSVSTVWAVCDEQTRYLIQQAHFAAVKAAIAYLEEGATTRYGKGGAFQDPAKLVVATFEHGTSRAQDPQLHTHALVLNIALRADGTSGALDCRHFFHSKMAAGALYRAELSRQIQGLGFEIEREKTTFEIKGTPAALMKEFSKRRAEIEAQLDSNGKSSAAAAAVAALDTRQKKEHRARHDLFNQWRAGGAEYNFTADQVQELKRFAPTRGAAIEMPEAIALAIEKISRDVSHFGERELVRAVAEECQGRALSAAQIRAAVKQELQKPEYVFLGQHKNEVRYTTRALWKMEKELLSDAKELSLFKNHLVEKQHYLQGILRAEQKATQQKRTRDPQAPAIVMNDEQRAAVAHITRETGEIALVSGAAGTGKTFMLDAARECWEAQGYKVIGASVAGKAARGLETSSGIKSSTVARMLLEWERGFDDPAPSKKFYEKVELLYMTWQIDAKTRRKLLAPLKVPKTKAGANWQYMTWQISKKQKELLDKQIERRERFQLDEKTVLVIDEVGMLGTRQWAELLRMVKETGAKFVGIGDEKQLPSVEVGGPFASLIKQFGAARMTKNVRQKHEWQREAVKDFSEGHAGKALRAFHEKGLLTVSDNREEAQRALINAWKEKGLNAPDRAFIIAGTRAEVKDLNRMAQDERRRAGKLGFRSLRVGGETINEKDRVLFLENKEVLGVSNGMTGTVKKVNQRTQTLTVVLDDNGQETLIPCREYQKLTLGYAMTTHKAQGMTVENAYILCGGAMADRELSYVQVSRATDHIELFTDKIMAWNPETGQREDATLSELARQMSRSRQKDMAHDVTPDQVDEILHPIMEKHKTPQPMLQPMM